METATCSDMTYVKPPNETIGIRTENPHSWENPQKGLCSINGGRDHISTPQKLHKNSARFEQIFGACRQWHQLEDWSLDESGGDPGDVAHLRLHLPDARATLTKHPWEGWGFRLGGSISNLGTWFACYFDDLVSCLLKEERWDDLMFSDCDLLYLVCVW